MRQSVIIWHFFIRLLKIDLILIWANARNTISHWPRVSYDLLDVLCSAVLCFYSELKCRQWVMHRDMVILRALALPAQFMNFKTPPLSYSSAPGSSAILVSPRKRRASLLLLFTACSITPSTSGILIFLETPNATAHPGFSLVRYLSYENLELSDSRVLLALSWSWDW